MIDWGNMYQESFSFDDIEDDYCCESVNWKDSSSIDTKLLLSSKTKELLKKYTDDPKNPYFDYRNETRKKYGELPKKVFDNLSALVKLVFKSKEYKEYKRFLDILCSAVGYDHNFAFMRNIGRNGDILLEYQKIGQKRPMTPTLRLFHTSNNPNLKELAPKFKSVSNNEVDGHQYETVEAIWPEPRVYFGYNTVVSRLGGDIKNDAHPERYFNGEQSYCYEYTGSKSLINGIFNDMELRGGNAVYVNTDKPLPVKRITYEEYKNAIKQESFSFNDIENDYFVQESSIDRVKSKIADIDEEIAELEDMLKKKPNSVSIENMLEDAKKRKRRWEGELEDLLDDDDNSVAKDTKPKPSIRYDSSSGMNVFTINKNPQNDAEFNKIYDICKKMKEAVNNNQWSSFESNASAFFKNINISDYESRRMMLNTVDRDCVQIWFTNAEKKVDPNNMRFFHCSHNSSITELKPTHMNAGKTIVYPCNAVFFIAISKSDNIDRILSNFKMYGGNVYEYTPSSSDIIYTDSKERRENGIPAVFIKTNKPLKVNKYQTKTVSESFSFDDIEDDYFVESALSYDNTFEVCKELYDEWTNFEYGIPIDGDLTTVTSAKEFDENYRFLSPDDFEKYGGGVCWDFVEWGAKFLRNKGIKFHQYYIQTDTPPNYDTHTFIVCHCGDKFVYPECAFDIIASDLDGLGTFSSLPEIYNYIASKMFECNGNKERFKEFKFSIYEYTQTPNYGCTCQEYMDFMKEHAHLVFKGVTHSEAVVKEHYTASSDKFVDYLHWKTEQYIQDNFDIIQEATKATKTRRMKKKILRDLKADKDGYGTITDGRGNETDVRIRFGVNRETHAGQEWDEDKQKVIRTLHINNNDMRRDNAIPAYYHEKNHISIDKRCGKRATSKTNKMGYTYSGYTKVYEDKQDVDDLKLIKMFIEKHRDELISEHSRDVDEYLADLNAARSIGYKRMIKTLDDIRTDTGKKLSLSAKYHKGSIKKQAMNETISSDRMLYDKYLSILNEMKEYHNKLKNSNAGKDTIKESEQTINECEKILKTQSTFDKYLRNKHKNDPLFVSRYNQLISEYNTDLKYRILFLREMAKYDKTKAGKKSEKAITESYCVNDPIDQLCAYMFDKHTDDHHIYEHTIIFDYLNGFLDKSVYSESDIHNMTDDVLSYIVLDDLESDVIDDIYYEADIYFPDNNDVKTYLEFKVDIINYLNDQEELDEITEARIERVNDKGKVVPVRCDKCGGDVAVIIRGEPVWLCKECRKYFGAVPCNIQEAKLTTTKRDKLKASEFGIPEKRTFPLNDKNHVEAAVRMFPHADDSDKKELAKRIIRKAHEFGMDTSKWELLNKYIQEADMGYITLSDIPYTTATAGYKPIPANESDINPFALFDKVPLNDFIIDKYKSKTGDMSIGLKHLRMNDRTKGFMWLNQQDEVVGYVAVEQKDIGPYIIALELSPKYQGRGLGKALLEFAENYLGGRYLSVSKKNERAFEMYKSCGWNVYDETPKMYFMKKDDNFVQPEQHKPMYFYHMIDKNISLDDKGLKTPDYVLKVEHNEELYLKMTDKYRNRLVSPDGWNIYPDKQPDELTADEIYNGINSFRGDSRGNNQIYMFRYPPTKELGPNMRAVLDTKDIYAFDINDPNNSKYINNINWGFDGSFTGNKPLSKDWYENISQDDYFSKYDDNGKMLFASLNHISIDPTLGYLPLSCLKKIDSDIQPVVQEGAWQDIKHGVNPKSKKLFFHISMDTKMNGKTLKPRIPTYLTKKDNVTTYKENATIPRVCFSPSIEGCLNAIISAQKNLDVVGKNIFVYIPEKPISEYKIKTNKEIIKEKLVFDANATGEMWILEPVKLKLYGVIMVDQVKNIREKPTINGDPHGRCDYKWHWAVKPKYVEKTLEYLETYDDDSKKKKTTKE